MQNVANLIVEKLSPDALILFGSRARGDHRPNSDFDLAIKVRDLDPVAWSSVKLDVSEDPITLHSVDLVHYERMPEDYQRNISREGKALYVR